MLSLSLTFSHSGLVEMYPKSRLSLVRLQKDVLRDLFMDTVVPDARWEYDLLVFMPKTRRIVQSTSSRLTSFISLVVCFSSDLGRAFVIHL
ncbi:unnamed protein product [Protopolystoma xenopodis]|uniref:Uncharacterized protein n=1 Tax=Protopolystoma xenopodis TaxID=117903 RepID=A0A3S5A171_9PLAT|nr:unnamed protein product [Protopolystoma xenopodis]